MHCYLHELKDSLRHSPNGIPLLVNYNQLVQWLFRLLLVKEQDRRYHMQSLCTLQKKKKKHRPFKLNQAVVENKPHHILAEQCRRSLLDFVEEHAIEALFKIVEKGKCKINDDHFESTSSKEENLKCTLMLLRGLHSLLTNEGKPSVTFLRQK